jgi:hypothetical protein
MRDVHANGLCQADHMSRDVQADAGGLRIGAKEGPGIDPGAAS